MEKRNCLEFGLRVFKSTMVNPKEYTVFQSTINNHKSTIQRVIGVCPLFDGHSIVRCPLDLGRWTLDFGLTCFSIINPSGWFLLNRQVRYVNNGVLVSVGKEKYRGEKIMVEESKEELKEENNEETTPKIPEFQKPLNKMTAPELREVGKEIPGVTGVHAMKKDELLSVIKEYYGIEDEAPIKKKKKKTEKPTVSVKELKAKIVQLRETKGDVRATKDRKKVDILRRRINRLKKQTRKVAQG